MHTSTTRRLPAEWEQHAATIVAWPGRPSVWGRHLDLGRVETLHLIQHIAEAEPVIVAASPSDRKELAGQLEGATGISLMPIPLDDCWARDIAPLFVVSDGTAELKAIDFNFNAWGQKFDPYDSDAGFGFAISRRLGIERTPVNLVMEGGSLTTDGRGTAIIVEPTVLNMNRNPERSKQCVEEILNLHLGIETFIWLPYGLLGDTDTDGHVDNVAAFCADGRVLVQVLTSTRHPDSERLAVNYEILSRSRDSSGRQLELVEIPWLPVSQLDGSRPSSYVNVYPTNRGVLVPTVGVETDDLALELISGAFGGRAAIPIGSNALSYGGGGPHCMTMQVPGQIASSTHEGDLK
jgi:agmatine deiminase